jgi:hypothetical protein
LYLLEGVFGEIRGVTKGTNPNNLTSKDMTVAKGMTMTGGEDMWTMIENKDCASRKLVKP